MITHVKQAPFHYSTAPLGGVIRYICLTLGVRYPRFKTKVLENYATVHLLRQCKFAGQKYKCNK
jgi:hypothetical protein